MKNILRIGMLLCSFLLASVGWAMAEEESGGGTTGITTLDGLKTAIQDATGDNPTITLGGDIIGANADKGSAITINKALTLDGANHTISGSAAEAILKITGTGAVTIKNLTVANNTEDGGSEIYVGTNPGTSTEFPVTAAYFENIKLSGTSVVGIAAEYHVNISIENVQETATSTHQFGIRLAGSDEQLKASLTIKGTGNKFDQCIMPIQIYDQDQATVTSEDDSFVKLPGSEDETYWTDRYNSSTETYTISTTGRTSASYSQELALLSNCIAADTENAYQKITLGAGDYELSSQLTINKAITLEGTSAENGPATKIKAKEDATWPEANKDKNLITIVAGSAADVTLKNIRVQDSKAAGINVQTANLVKLENVACENNTTAGLLVHAPVEATNFHTVGNDWGGVNIDNGKNGDSDTNVYNPTFKFDANSTFAESKQIWSELADKEAAEIVTLPGNTTWRAIKGKSDDGQKNMWFWTNASPKTVTTAEALVSAVNSASDGDVILLGAGTYELSTPLVITKAITIKGDDSKSVIKAVEPKESFTPYGTNDYNLITISGAGAGSVKLENLRITRSHGSGLNVQTAMKTYLDKVQLYDNANAGLLVHSEVEAQFLETEDNKWGGVNIDKGTPEYTRKLTIKSNGYNFREKVKIWAEKENCPNPYETVSIQEQDSHLTYKWAVVEGKGGEKWDTDMIYWVTTDKPKNDSNYTTIFVSDYSTVKDSEGNPYYNANFYANGNQVKVVAKDEHYTKIVNGESEEDFIVLPYQNRASLYGGAKNGSVNSTSITMEGGQLRNVYGGGYSPVGSTTISRANVFESATITLNEGAQVTNILQGGGYHYSKVPTVNIRATNAKIGYLMVGGYDQGLTGNTIDTPLADSNNGVQTVNVNITGGEILVMGCGGGQGYSRTGSSTVTVNGTKIGYLYGTYSNGRADLINATFTNCEITDELALINRGAVTDANFVFNNCTYGANLYSSVAATIGWANSDTKGTPLPVVDGSVSFTFTGDNTPIVNIGRGVENANVSITGATAQIKKFEDITNGKGIESLKDGLSTFSIAEGKTWTFNGGLRFATEEIQKATIKNNGTIQLPFYGVLPALVGGLEGALAVEKDSMAFIVQTMNATQDITKSDFSNKTFSIECQDGVIASNKNVAKELLAAGKIVSVLSFDNSEYKIDDYNKVPAQITNLPDSVVFGTAPIKLAFNQKNVEASIKEESSEVASITAGVLTILKPGEVTIALKVKKSDNSSEYDQDLAAEQKLKVTKRIVTLISGLEVDYGTSEETTPPTSKVYDGSTEVTVKMKDALTFAGKLGNGAAGLSLADYTSGTMADANVGEGKLVTIANAKLAKASEGNDSTAFYELAPITFVKATVTPKPITITATDKSVAYGETVEYAVDDYSSSLVSGDKLDGTLKFSCAVKTDTTATNYPSAITPYGLTSPNYAITFVAGKLTVTAIAPSIEITEAKVVQSGTNKNIEFKARLIHNGGVAVTAVTFKNGETDVPATLENDIYSGKIENVQSDSETNYTLKAVATNSAGNGEASVSLKVDAKAPQNLSWAPSVLPTLVYGQKMTIAATSDQPAANGAYTYSVVAENGETPIASITDGILKATKVGKVTIKAERAADAIYSAATLTKTIEITPKPITVSVAGLEKVYNGTPAIATPPTFTLSGVESGDEVSVNTNVTLSYASKNAGDNVAVILPELTLTGAAANNYTLVQPKNVTGKINKAPLIIKVKNVIRPWNQRHTKYEFETDGLVNGETLAQAYSGTLAVAEKDGVLKLTVEANKSQNYDVTAENGTLTITKGMPKAVVYGSGNDWNGMIVDYQGYDSNDLTLDNTNVASGGKALIKLKNGQVLTSSINSKPSTSSSSANAASFSLRSASLRGAVTPSWNVESFTFVEYGSEAMTFSSETGFTYTSTNMSVLTVATVGMDVTVTPVGVGNATIIAEKTGEVKIWNVTVTPKSLGMTATGMDRIYDGTATATGTVALNASDIVGRDDVALDLSGITFNYADKNVANDKAIVSSQNLVLIGTNANNYTIDASSLKGDITQKTLTVNDPIAVYYNGQKTHTLTTYPATGLVAGDVAPITVTFDDAAVGTRNISSIALTSTGDAANYTLASSKPSTGTIQRSTLVATLPTNASSVNDLKNNITLAIRETGEAVAASAVGFVPTITTSGSGANTVYSVTGGETTNYSVVYNRNQIGYAAPVIPGGGGGTVDPEPEIPTVSNPVVAERTATTAVITWEKVSGATSYKLFLYAKKTDSTPLKTYEFDKDGKLKATTISFTLTGLEEGKSYYIETAAYNALGTLLVKKSVELSATPTGIESISEGSQLYTVKGAVVVSPAEPLQVAIYSVTGQTLFNDEVSYLTQVPAKAGIYVVVIQKGNDRITEKVFVK